VFSLQLCSIMLRISEWIISANMSFRTEESCKKNVTGVWIVGLENYRKSFDKSGVVEEVGMWYVCLVWKQGEGGGEDEDGCEL